MLKAGYAKVNVTPMMGIGISGYFKVRLADGVLDELEVVALALEVDGKQTLMLCADNLGINKDLNLNFREHISEVTGVPVDSIYLAATHTHTGPGLVDKDGTCPELIDEYNRFLYHRMADVSAAALEDLKPAKMGYGIGNAPNVAFVRRFRMKDGFDHTAPGVDHPDIEAPIGMVDERVSVVRFDREGAESLVLVNFANHPDVVGGNKISADWPGLLRGQVERSLDNVKCIFFNGCQGDINHVNVHPRGGYLNDIFKDFDDASRGYGHAKYIARVVTGGVLQAYDKVQYTDVDDLVCLQKTMKISSNMPDPKELPEARYIDEMHKAGKDAELPYKGMMLTTMVAQAARMLRLEHGPEYFEMPISGIKLGPVAFVGLPGEPFNGIGRALKETEGYGLVIPTCCTNGYQGYFPMKDAYDEGGYEAGTSSFKAGSAEQIIEEGKQLLKEMAEA